MVLCLSKSLESSVSYKQTMLQRSGATSGLSTSSSSSSATAASFEPRSDPSSTLLIPPQAKSAESTMATSPTEASTAPPTNSISLDDSMEPAASQPDGYQTIITESSTATTTPNAQNSGHTVDQTVALDNNSFPHLQLSSSSFPYMYNNNALLPNGSNNSPLMVMQPSSYGSEMSANFQLPSSDSNLVHSNAWYQSAALRGQHHHHHHHTGYTEMFTSGADWSNYNNNTFSSATTGAYQIPFAASYSYATNTGRHTATGTPTPFYENCFNTYPYAYPNSITGQSSATNHSFGSLSVGTDSSSLMQSLGSGGHHHPNSSPDSATLTHDDDNESSSLNNSSPLIVTTYSLNNGSRLLHDDKLSPVHQQQEATSTTPNNMMTNASNFNWVKKSSSNNGKTRTKDKYRVVYTDKQRTDLEMEFRNSRYITIKRKSELAGDLGLSERQVKIWFQNRRAKDRKQDRKKEESQKKDKCKSDSVGVASGGGVAGLADVHHTATLLANGSSPMSSMLAATGGHSVIHQVTPSQLTQTPYGNQSHNGLGGVVSGHQSATAAASLQHHSVVTAAAMAAAHHPAHHLTHHSPPTMNGYQMYSTSTAAQATPSLINQINVH